MISENLFNHLATNVSLVSLILSVIKSNTSSLNVDVDSYDEAPLNSFYINFTSGVVVFCSQRTRTETQ